MGKFHSTLNRREFLKAAGLVGAGIGATAGVAPVIRDLDELAAYPHTDAKQPWWIRERDHLDPTMEVDWNMMQRYDMVNVMNSRISPTKWATGVWNGQRWEGEYDNLPATENTAEGIAAWAKIQDIGYDNAKKWIEQTRPGFSMRDFALEEGTSWGNPRSFLGPKAKFGPKYWDVPQYSGTPEDNASMLRQFMRHVGAFEVGFLELDDKTKKLIYTRERNPSPGGHRRTYPFEDVTEAYETDKKQVIPTTTKWIITFINQMSPDDYQASPAAQTRTGSNVGYANGQNIQWCTQKFLKALGYQCLGENATNTLGIAPGLATLGGIIEMNRFNQGFNPHVGAMYRAFHMLTDMPLAPKRPMDAGMFRFCRDCVKCAEVCPPQVITYEKEPYWETQGAYNNPGHKAYFVDRFPCQAQRAMTTGGECAMCQGACVFTKKALASVHDVVKMTVSMTSVFNGFFTNLDKAFGYPRLENYWPLQNGETDDQFNPRGADWWNRDLPVYGFDTTLGCTGWRK